MAYFSKEVYDRKRDYAYRISNEGLEKIALYLVSENPKYKNADLDDEDVQDEIDSEIEDLIYELEPIANLSHFRHELHSTKASSLFNTESADFDLPKQYDDDSEDCLYYEVMELNKKYGLVNKKLPPMPDFYDVPYNWLEVYDPYSSDGAKDIYNEDEFVSKEYTLEEWLSFIDSDEITEKLYDLSYEIDEERKNKWSDSVRQWFKEINKKFDTDFPD